MKEYSIDELIKFCREEIDTLEKLDELFEERPSESRDKFVSIIEKLNRLDSIDY